MSKQRDRSKQGEAPRIDRRWVQSAAPTADASRWPESGAPAADASRRPESGAPAADASRWPESGAPVADIDNRIAALLADVPPPAALSPARLAAVAARLPGRALPTRLPGRLGIRWAIVLSFLLGSASAVFARKQIAHLWDQVTTARPIFGPTAAPNRPPRRHPAAGVSAETPPAAQPSIAEPEGLDVAAETPPSVHDPSSRRRFRGNAAACRANRGPSGA